MGWGLLADKKEVAGYRFKAFRIGIREHNGLKPTTRNLLYNSPLY